MKSFYKYISSIRLTILLTYLIVTVSIIGSFVILYARPEFEGIDKVVLIEWLGNTRPAISWWIISLITLIAIFSVNTIFCTFDRISSLVSAWRGKKVAKSAEEATLLTEDIERRGIRFRTLLPYIAHIGVLITLSGHLVGSIWGFRGGDIMVAEGETVHIKELKSMSIKAGELNIKISKMGYPEVMTGNISLLSGGKVVRQKVAGMNRPLLYEDIAVYIKNVQSVPRGLIVKMAGGDAASRFLITPGVSRQVDEKGLRIVGGSVDRRYGAMELLFFDGNRLIKRGWISPYDPKRRSIIFRGYNFLAEDVSLANAGTFTVNRDPGARLVFAGLTLFAFSLIPHLFLRRSKKQVA